MKYRKNPVVIDAIQLTRNNIREVYELIHATKLDFSKITTERYFDDYIMSVRENGMDIPTLEDGDDKRAKHVATIGDWIIKGIKGEFYPCKPDIFEMTYEAVKD